MENEKKLDDVESTYYDTLVLSGGSNKTILTLGALQCAVDNYILEHINIYVGTSSGAIISYMLCIGYTPIELLVYLCTNQIFEALQNYSLVNLANGKGACSFNPLQEHLEKITIEKIGYLPTLNDIKERYNKTLICVTYNYTETMTEYLSWENYPHLPCITALKMSANLPLVFDKYRYGDSFYVDGAVSDNFPVKHADKIGKKIIGIMLNSLGSENTDSNETVIDYFYNLLFIPISQNTNEQLENLSPKTNIVKINHQFEFKFFNFNINTKTKLEMFSVGYTEMKDKIFNK
jgi:predicted acylesterase/phospholipase RssA